MNQKLESELSGSADLHISGLQIWVHGRHFQESEGYGDGNWLRVTAHCSALGSSVWIQGAMLMVTDIAGFGDSCAAILRGGRKMAVLAPLEPELKVSLEKADKAGHICAQVDITPDYLSQTHSFKSTINQTALSSIIRECSTILEKFPIRKKQDRNV